MSASVRIVRHPSATDFLQASGPLLQTQEAGNSFILGIADRYVRKPAEPGSEPLTWSAWCGSDCVGALVRTPGRSAWVYVAPEAPQAAVEQVLAELLAPELGVGGAIVPSWSVQSLLRAWRQQRGADLPKDKGIRSYHLDRVTPPRGVGGDGRLAGEADADLVGDWRVQFMEDGGEQFDAQSVRTGVVKSVRRGEVLLWEHDGVPVSMASAVRPTQRGICISAVYTPPQHRGHGYASAVVARLSQRQLDAGKEFVCLYTNLSRPVPNRIYPRLGYVPVMDWEHWKIRDTIPFL